MTPTMHRLPSTLHLLSGLGMLAGLLAAEAQSLPTPSTTPLPHAFALPTPGRHFEFPRDHGSHPEFRLEWWYVTGHLRDEKGGRFGFQSTFFRTTAPPVPGVGGAGSDPAGSSPRFGSDHLHLAHAALLEVASGRFLHQERLQREGWDAGAATGTLHVWNAHHSLVLLPATASAPGQEATRAGSPPPLRLRGSVRAEAVWDLRLVPSKPLVIFGTNGVSRKGADPAAASHYLTFPRLEVSGTLILDGSPRSVRGQAWMDHEFSSSQLAADQTGWDWASVQFHDGRELMAYRLRRRDGSTDPFSTLAWIDREGRVEHVGPGDFHIEAPARWRSPRTGAEYPAGLRITTRDPANGRERSLTLEPLAADQELAGAVGGVPYWEGACRVLESTGQEVGAAFVELTGYAGDLNRRLR